MKKSILFIFATLLINSSYAGISREGGGIPLMGEKVPSTLICNLEYSQQTTAYDHVNQTYLETKFFRLASKLKMDQPMDGHSRSETILSLKDPRMNWTQDIGSGSVDEMFNHGVLSFHTYQVKQGQYITELFLASPRFTDKSGLKVASSRRYVVPFSEDQTLVKGDVGYTVDLPNKDIVIVSFRANCKSILK